MPVRGETATFDPSLTQNNNARWVTQALRGWDTEVARHGTLVALCDSQAKFTPHNDPRPTALSVLEDYYYHPPREDLPERTLADAIVQALFIAQYYSGNAQKAPTNSYGAMGEGESTTTAPQDELSIIAAVVDHGTLYVAQSGQHRAFIWRDGKLIPLDIASPSALAMGQTQYKLTGKDRVLVCSEDFYQNVPEPLIADILKTTRGPHDAVTRLMGAAVQAQPAALASVAVLDYDSIFSAMGLPKGVLAALLIVLVLSALAWSLRGRFSLAGNAYSLAPPFTSSTSSTPTLSLTQSPAPNQTPNDTPVAATLPTGGIAIDPISATVQPTPTPIGTETPATAPTSAAASASATIPHATPTLNVSSPTIHVALALPAETATSVPLTPSAIPRTATPPPTRPPTATPLPPTNTPVTPTPSPVPPTASATATPMALATATAMATAAATTTETTTAMATAAATATAIAPPDLVPSVQALNPLRVILGRNSAAITLTVQIGPAAPAAYLLYVRQGQTLNVQVTRNAYMKIMNTQGQALTFPAQSVQFPIMQTADYVVLVTGEGRVTVHITITPSQP